MAGLLKKLLGAGKRTAEGGRCSAVVVAAGSSTRMEGEDKLFVELCGIPVLARSLMALQKSPHIIEIIVVARQESIVEIADLCGEYDITKVTKVVCGGETRLESAMNGVMETSPKARLIAIHDGARPLVDQDIIRDAIHGAENFNASIPAVRVQDTVKVVENYTVKSTPERSALYAVQTPQIFNAELIKGALQSALEERLDITDDSMAVERLGVNVHISRGSYENIKITTPVDVDIAESILRRRGEKL